MENRENRADVLNSLINLPQLLKDNTELVAKIQKQIDYNNKTLGSSLTKFTETLTAVKEVKNSIKIDELRIVNDSFNRTIDNLKYDLNNVIISDVTKKFDAVIDPKLKKIEQQNNELLKSINTLNSKILELDSKTLEVTKAIEIHKKFLENDTFKEIKNRTFNLIVMFILSIFGLYFYLSPEIKSPFLKTAIMFFCILGLLIAIADWIYCLIAHKYTTRE